MSTQKVDGLSMPSNYAAIVRMARQVGDYEYPDTHIWDAKMSDAIRMCYAGAVSASDRGAYMRTLARVIELQDRMIGELRSNQV